MDRFLYNHLLTRFETNSINSLAGILLSMEWDNYRVGHQENNNIVRSFLLYIVDWLKPSQSDLLELYWVATSYLF